MNYANTSADLAALKELRGDLQEAERLKQRISRAEQSAREASAREVSKTYGNQLPTNRYEKERQKYIEQNQQKHNRIMCPFWTVAIVLFVVLAGLWLVFSGVFQKDTYLHTPEVVGEYSGTYYNSTGKCRATLTITSCSESGKLEGYFEFYDKGFGDKETYGKYTIRGNILTKSKGGYITAKIAYYEWVEQPSGYSPLKDMQITIYEDCKKMRGEHYDLCLFASDYVESDEAAELYTPEIVKTYSGEFTPNTGKVGTASVTIESCDEAGQVKGFFECSYGDAGKGKWVITGQITEKRTDGSVKLTVDVVEKVYNSYMFYYPSANFEVEIYDQYRSFYSREGMRWYYAEEGFNEDPDPVITPTQALAQKAKPILFIGYPILIVVLAVLLSLKRTDSFTPEQQEKLAELTRLDLQNQEANKQKNEQRRAEAERKRKEDVSFWNQSERSGRRELENCQNRIRRATILADTDKDLSNVNFLIQQLETGRADTLKEALNQMDAKHRRDSERWLRYETERLAAQQRAQFEADQARHNLNMEYEARRKNDELEKIRKALED